MRESLRVLDRCGVTDCAEEIYCEFVREELPDALGGKLPGALREKLLMAAQNELCACQAAIDPSAGHLGNVLAP